MVIVMSFSWEGKKSAANTSHHPNSPYLYEIYITNPLTNNKILPNTYPIPGSPAQEVRMTACRGEYEPATLVIHALQDLKDLLVTGTDLTGAGSTIPASAVDIRVVKCWFQSGVTDKNEDKYIFTPELLLKDDKLVMVDVNEKKNYLQALNKEYVLISAPESTHLQHLQMRDADVLQPTSLPVGMVKQFWITVHVPETALPGQYEGKIKVHASHAPTRELTLRLRVLPFALETPAVRFAIYYRGKLAPYPIDTRAMMIRDGRPTISAEWKSPEEYLAEMQDLKAHGMEYPTIYQGLNQEHLLRQELALREKAGLPKEAFYSCGLITGNPTTPEELAELKRKVRLLIGIARQYGYQEVYVYGIDEATGEKLTSQRPAWNAVHEAGGKVFTSVYRGALEVMGDILDLAILNSFRDFPDVAEVEKYHKLGKQVFPTAQPRIGLEEPETYRRRYGLMLWKAGYDGAMNYAYQEHYGKQTHIWNDFDYQGCRSQVFAYPTVNGVIDTIQWEGQRAGVDDVRYLTTLLKAIQTAGSAKPQLAAEAQAWVNRIDPQGDLDELRTTMINWILKLQ